MRIYTKSGDKGTTALFGGKRVPKDDIRIEAYGTVDELNSFIGLLNSAFVDATQNHFLTEVQKRLFTIGSNLASNPDKEVITPDIEEDDINAIEKEIDMMQDLLPKLKNFILPGGHQAAGFAHVCRTVCRRAERRVITLDRDSTVDPLIIKYLNRLSDYFFVLSRYIVMQHKGEEILWSPRMK
ncbi:MAG: cob(I)yrinic acid a,c-diamide adenosyltransferase [Saprospiraceae bacterium]|nr:MAG: ATP/cobalamin adenosyltransferase [Bacteroidetes bacterium OLB9]MCO6463646.1 cob(I)yrinic acid a,c-diamide adenosyltransferase [Saprospiraceae bacterium]MCZ2338866.1 cob(I)yrinic acid a,c-diamide adenosyltransferase [Chitinophagales bacterium]